VRPLSDDILNNRICYACGLAKTEIQYRKNVKPKACWILNHDTDNNVLCTDCYLKHFYGPTFDHKKRSARRFSFMGRTITSNWLKKSGICCRCKKSVRKGQIPRTCLDHEYYITALPWYSTNEYCSSCHMKIGIERGQINSKRASFIRNLKRSIDSKKFCVVPMPIQNDIRRQG
jgi:hypothetical protein